MWGRQRSARFRGDQDVSVQGRVEGAVVGGPPFRLGQGGRAAGRVVRNSVTAWEVSEKRSHERSGGPAGICSTNAIESANARIRRAVKARGHFPDEQGALKYVCMAIMSLDPTGTGRERWTMRCKPALNAFDIAFDSRLAAERE